MTKTNMDLSELLAKQDGGDFLRAVAEAVLQLIMEADVEGLIGAGKHERADQRTTWRNGYPERALDTRLGTLNLKVPKLRQGSYFPGVLEARKTSEQALVAVIQEAWISGVSTRRVDDLVQAMGLSGISKSTVSKLCKDIDERVGEFLNRPLTGDWPYVWLDATYLKQRQGGRIVSVAEVSGLAYAMPTLAESTKIMSSSRYGISISRISRSPKASTLSTLSAPWTKTTNSSPPSRATNSLDRTCELRRVAISRRTRSPAAWPFVSLTLLKPSTSMNSAAVDEA